MVTGLVYFENSNFILHQWNEICQNGIWYGIDPTINLIPVSIAYLKIADIDENLLSYSKMYDIMKHLNICYFEIK